MFMHRGHPGVAGPHAPAGVAERTSHAFELVGIGAALALFAIEFFADKIPAFDLFWNALHTLCASPLLL